MSKQKIQFGVRLPVSGPLASIPAITDIARKSEELHYDSIWVHDHIAWNRESHEHHISSGSSEALSKKQEPDFYESLTTLSYLAALTREIKLGIACAVIPCRNPVYLAKQAANLDNLSKGRLILGAGLGSKATKLAREFELFDSPVKTRRSRFVEYLNAIQTLWREDRASFSGKYVSFKDVEMYPKPVQKPGVPLWIGGWSRGSAERAVEVGDGWIPGWLTPEEMLVLVPELKESLTRHGRNEANFTVAVEKYLCLFQDRQVALGKAMATIGQSKETYERALENLEFAKTAHILGNVSDVQSKVAKFVDAGVTHFEFKFIYSSVKELGEMMELFADKVMQQYA